MKEDNNIGLNGYSSLPSNERELNRILHPESIKGGRVAEKESIKISRNYLLQAQNIERGLLQGIEDNLFSIVAPVPKPKDEKIKITGLTKKISSHDLASLTFAIGKTLYDQSITNRNEEYNTGVADKSLALTPKGNYRGEIVISLKELCKVAYGEKEPTSKQLGTMKRLIEEVHKTPTTIEHNGVKDSTTLFWIMDRREITNTQYEIYYRLGIHPVLCGELIKNNFALFPSDASYLLTEAIRRRKKRRSPQHIWLMNFIASQKSPCRIRFDNLLLRLDLVKDYKKNPSRTQEFINNLITIMKDIGLLRADLEQNPEIEYSKTDGMTIYVFHKNPEWSKNRPPALPK